MKYNKDNVFYKIIHGVIKSEFIGENESTICIKDINPQSKIHYLVIPKGEYVNMFDFHANATEQEIRLFWNLVNKVMPKDGKVLANYGSYLEVHHFHLHVLG